MEAFSTSFYAIYTISESFLQIFSELGPNSKIGCYKKLQFFSATEKYLSTFEIRHSVGGDTFSNILINDPLCAQELTLRTF